MFVITPLKHKMTRYAKNLGGHGSLAPLAMLTDDYGININRGSGPRSRDYRKQRCDRNAFACIQSSNNHDSNARCGTRNAPGTG